MDEVEVVDPFWAPL